MSGKMSARFFVLCAVAASGCGSGSGGGGPGGTYRGGGDTPLDFTTPSDLAPAPKHLFISSATYVGATLGGAAGADTLCSRAGHGALLGGAHWKAWLSTTTENAIDRLADVAPWYVRDEYGVDRLVFNNKDQMANTPASSISWDERGKRLMMTSYWSGTALGGTLDASREPLYTNCSDWNSDPNDVAPHGVYGNSGATDDTWTRGGTLNCIEKLSLLCIEQ